MRARHGQRPGHDPNLLRRHRKRGLHRPRHGDVPLIAARRRNMKLAIACTLLLPVMTWATTAHVAADTYITNTNAAQNFGSATTLNIGNGAAAMIGLDLSPLPAGLTSANIARATLT